MIKRMVSVLLAVMMVVSVMAVGVVNTAAATTDGFTPESTKIYFDVDGTGWTMGTKDKIAFCIVGGDFGTEANPTEPVAWGGKKLQGTATTGETGIFEFDPVAKVGYKFTKDVQYKIIFARVSSNNWKEQTCSLFFTTDCFGHVAYSDGTEMENDVDSSKKSKTVYWRGIDPEENGPALCITSIGNVVGSCVEQGKTKYSLFEEFISEAKKDFGGKTGLENAIYYTVEQAKTKTEQKLIDDIGAALGLTKDDVAKAFTDNEVSTAWTAADSALPAGQGPHTHTPGKSRRVNVVPASCEEEGSYDEVIYCNACGEELSRSTKTIPFADHSLQYIPEVKSTYDAPGVKAHYQCTVCDKLFADEAGNVEVTDDDLHIPLVEMKIGDINKDYEITVMDATYIQEYLSYQRSLNGGVYEPVEKGSRDFTVADVDGDGRISIFDSLRIQRYCAMMCKLDGSPYDA